MSRYVQRCVTCREVRGVSAFRVERAGGGRAATCRWCEDQRAASKTATRVYGQVDALNRRRFALAARLKLLEQDLKKLESDTRALSGAAPEPLAIRPQTA